MIVNFKDVQVLHLELTSSCNAKCPQCSRENPGRYDKSKKFEILLDDCKRLFPIEFIKQLDKLLLCGDYGDPIVARDVVEICEYFRMYNPTITLGVNTNGSIRTKKWWSYFGTLFTNVTDNCVFSIDGLEDTHSLYRIGTSYDKILKNASSFIASGGNAHWDMLVFKHNEHQVNDARDLAKSMGFKWFRAKVTKRFVSDPVDFLYPPNSIVDDSTILEKRKVDIKCMAIEEKSIYMSANKKIYPCCWIGEKAYINDSKLTYYLKNNAENIKKSWNKHPYDICLSICNVNKNNKNNFNNQWVWSEEF